MNDAVDDFFWIKAAVTSDAAERLDEGSLYNSSSLSDIIVSRLKERVQFLSYLRKSRPSAGKHSFRSCRTRSVQRIFNHLPSSFLFGRCCAADPDDRDRPRHSAKAFLKFVPFNGLFHDFELLLNLIAATPYFCGGTSSSRDRCGL